VQIRKAESGPCRINTFKIPNLGIPRQPGDTQDVNPASSSCLVIADPSRTAQLRLQSPPTGRPWLFRDVGLNKDSKMVAPAVPEYVHILRRIEGDAGG
jgi:hypothetical protein